MMNGNNWRQFGDSKTNETSAMYSASSRGLANSHASNMSSGIDDYQSQLQQRLYATSEIESWNNTGYHK